MESLVGATIEGRYRIEAEVGAGGMGTVYRARHLLLDQRVALKVLRADGPDHVDAARRFTREARTAFRIDHPSCVRVTDFGATGDGLLYLVMEYLDGRTLGRELAVDGAMAPSRVAHVAAQVASALEHAAGLGLVHRDLKPDNVMLLVRGADADFAKVLDFGLAKIYEHGGATALSLSPLTRDGMVFGTPEYMSPEQAKGGELGPPTDVYSLGVVCYEMLTGRVPFAAEAFTAILAMHVQDTPEPPSAHRPCPPALEALVMACLAKRPADRPTAAELRLGFAAAREREVMPRAVSEASASETLELGQSGIASAAELSRTALGLGAARARSGGPPAAAPVTTSQGAAATALGIGAVPRGGPRAISATGSMPAVPRRRRPALVVAAVVAVALIAAIALRRSDDAPRSATASADAAIATSAAPSSDAAIATSAAPSSDAAIATSAGPSPDAAPADTSASAASPADTTAAAPTSPPRQRPSPTFTRHLRAAEAARKDGNALRQLAEAHEALELEPRHRRALFLVGDALIASGDRARGCRFLRRASQRSFRDAGCAD